MMSSMYIGATGMKTHAEGMNVVSNNLANVNTVGFKKTMMLYQDLISQTATTQSNNVTNLSQVGAGARVGDYRKVFSQGGGFETGSAATDMGIQGIGFYGVEKDGKMHYTRAGNFRFDQHGALLDPTGWNLMGYRIGANGQQSSSPEPVKLDLSAVGIGTMPASASTTITLAMQLGNINNEPNTANPYFSMAAAYDGTASPPLTSGQYAYSQPIEFYDAAGKKQTATLYVNRAGEDNGRTAMEYLVAWPAGVNPSGTDKSAGLIMGGTLSFASTGRLVNITAFTPPGGDPSNLAGWTAAPVANGHPVMNIGGQSIALDLGLTMSGPRPATAAAAAADPSLIYDEDEGAVRSTTATIKYGTSNGSIIMGCDGYPEGSIKNLTISETGRVTAQYSNNQSQDLYTIALYRFTSQDGLRREGNNHFSATPESGEGTPGVPGSENYGKIASWALETSNVDYAEEFATLIITQRGFQANSKIITTSDMMLQKAMELKR